MFGCQLIFLSLVDHNNHKANKLSHNCLSQELNKWCVFGRVSCLVLSVTPVTCLVVRLGGARRQADRTRKRVAELLASKEDDSGLSSEEEQDCSPEENRDSLSAVRRDLYLGLLCLLLLVLLLVFWLCSVCRRFESFLR